MDFGDITGGLALLVSILALLAGWKADNTTRKLVDNLSQAHRRESERVDKFIDDLLKRLDRD